MKILAGVDGGNSKTDVVLLTDAGTVLSEVSGPTLAPHLVGMEASVQGLEELLERARREANLASDSHLDILVIYLAGLDLEDQTDRYAHRVRRQHLSADVLADNDIFAVIRAGMSGSVGIALVCGAGVGCGAVGPSGLHARYLALGEISGDFGGGIMLVRRALCHAVRAEDGRGPFTLLSQMLSSALGAASALHLAALVGDGEVTDFELGRAAPVVFEVANLNDEVALGLVNMLAEECVLMITALARRLDMVSRPIAVVLAGGVMRARPPGLVGQIEVRLSEQLPLARLHWLKARPVGGAALSALDRAAAPPRAYDCVSHYFGLGPVGSPVST